MFICVISGKTFLRNPIWKLNWTGYHSMRILIVIFTRCFHPILTQIAYVLQSTVVGVKLKELLLVNKNKGLSLIGINH